jgi:hypothetical protein
MFRSITQDCLSKCLFRLRNRSQFIKHSCHGVGYLSTITHLPEKCSGAQLSDTVRSQENLGSESTLKSDITLLQSVYEKEKKRRIRYNEMKKISPDRDNYTMKLGIFLNNRLHDFELQDVCDFMRLFGKKSKSNGTLHHFLPAIVAKLEELKASGEWTYLHLAFLAYGLQCFDGGNANVSKIIDIISEKASVLVEMRLAPLPQDIAMMMVGLQNNACEDSSSRKLLFVLARMMDICRIHTPLIPKEVQNLLYGMKSMNSDNEEVRAVLKALPPLLSTCVAPLSASEVANIVYGLQGMSSTEDSVRAVISCIVPLAAKCEDPFSGQNVGNVVYGMQGMDPHFNEVEQLITAVIPNIGACSERLRSQAVGNALYGLRMMTCDNRKVISLLRVLIPKVMECDEQFTAQAVSNALYGMRGMSSETPEVQYLIKALLPKIHNCTEQFKPQAVGNSLYGMKRMKTDHAFEVQELLGLIMDKVRSCSEPLNPQEICNALYGMQGMSDLLPETSQLLDLIGQKIVRCKGTFRSQEVSNALYGFNRMGSKTPAVRKVLWTLYPVIVNCKDKFSQQEIGMALYGMRSMCNSSEEVRDIISALTPKLANCPDLLLAQGFICAVHGLRRMDCSDPVLRDMIRTLTVHVKKSPLEINDYQKSVFDQCIESMGMDLEEVRDLAEAFEAIYQPARSDEALYRLLDYPSYDDVSQEEMKELAASKPNRLPPKLASKLQKYDH